MSNNFINQISNSDQSDRRQGSDPCFSILTQYAVILLILLENQ
jgi:hypothetical protein